MTMREPGRKGEENGIHQWNEELDEEAK